MKFYSIFLYTTINASRDVLTLKVRDTIVGCTSGISLKTKNITDGSSPNLTYSYWKDTSNTIALNNYTSIQKTGTYYIKATNKAGCIFESSVFVVINSPPVIKIIAPNTFTPNGDGTNDLFTISYEGALQVDYFKIFNRYGQQVFETKQLSNFWDGTFGGSKTPAGASYWVLQGSDTYRKERVVRSGNITVIG